MTLDVDQVSCRTLGFHRKVAELLGISLEHALDGTGVDASWVERGGHLPWSSFARSMHRLHDLSGGREAFVELGRLVNRPDTHPAYARVLGQLVNLRLLTTAAGRWAAPSLFPCLSAKLSWIGRRRFLYEIDIPPHLEGCEPVLLIGLAGMRTLPSWIALPDAQGTEVIEHDRRAWADLTLPRTPSVTRRMRNALDSLSPGKRLVEELIAQNQELREQKAALARLTREAEEQRRLAERASRVKSDFVAAVSHELRTPMNAVVIAANLLRSSSLDDSQREHADVMMRSAAHMTRVLEDLIDLEGLEVGQLRFEPVAFKLREATQEVVSLLAQEASVRGLALEIECPDDVSAPVVGDPARLKQVLLNLISNSLRYTAAGGVRVRLLSLSSERVRVEVRDTGPGLDEDEQVRIFEPFVQGAARASTRGAGLGLTIVQYLVRRMRGEVGVNSAPGEGSTFWFELPLPRADGGEAAASDVKERSRDGEAARVRQVLLVEDDELTRKVFVLLLRSLGCVVDVAEDGQRGVSACAERRYDLVLMDCQMPVMGGLEATRAIRDGDGPNRDTCIVGLTAGTREADPMRWSAAGMTDLLQKPLDVEVLRALLASLPERGRASAAQ